MAYLNPYIDESGLHIPSYIDIRDDLKEIMKEIYGSDIYLENDSQDYQLLSAFSNKMHDVLLLAQQIYNNRGPSTSIGAALDGVVKINGIKRKRAYKGKCESVVITGRANTVITDGVISDDNMSVKWDLPHEVVIPQNGTVTVTATCQLYGVYPAPKGTLTKIMTPMFGWTSVTNTEDAVPGQAFETSSKLRARQTISTARPSRTVLEGTSGGIAEIVDVTRHRMYENDTNITDENTLPGHSICAVVEGGDAVEIATEIHNRKTPGCYTYGDVEVNIERLDIYGAPAPVTIRFFRPIEVEAFVSVKVKRLPGYLTRLTDEIRENISAYLNNLQIGEDLVISSLWGIALQAMPNINTPVFSVVEVTAGRTSGDMSSEDIDILFNEVLKGNPDNIEVILV